MRIEGLNIPEYENGFLIDIPLIYRYTMGSKELQEWIFDRKNTDKLQRSRLQERRSDTYISGTNKVLLSHIYESSSCTVNTHMFFNDMNLSYFEWFLTKDGIQVLQFQDKSRSDKESRRIIKPHVATNHSTRSVLSLGLFSQSLQDVFQTKERVPLTISYAEATSWAAPGQAIYWTNNQSNADIVCEYFSQFAAQANEPCTVKPSDLVFMRFSAFPKSIQEKSREYTYMLKNDSDLQQHRLDEYQYLRLALHMLAAEAPKYRERFGRYPLAAVPRNASPHLPIGTLWKDLYDRQAAQFNPTGLQIQSGVFEGMLKDTWVKEES